MNNYEVMYIVKPVEEEAYSAVVKKFDDLLTANGATIEKTDKWGKKELDRVMKITDEILRHMIIRKGE